MVPPAALYVNTGAPGSWFKTGSKDQTLRIELLLELVGYFAAAYVIQNTKTGERV